MSIASMAGTVSSGSGKFWRANEGANKVRIVTTDPIKLLVLYSESTGNFYKFLTEEGLAKAKPNLPADAKASVKYAVYLINRDAGGLLQQAELPLTVMTALINLATSDEYKFDGLIPYDISINKLVNNGKTTYTITPARTNTELAPEELALVNNAPALLEEIKRSAEDGDSCPPEMFL